MLNKAKLYLQLARPHQFFKNGFVWLPIFFGAKLADLGALEQTLIAFAAFCCAAGGVYVLNDLKDVEEDRRHPTKKNRPLASGAIEPPGAMMFMAVLLILAALLGALLPRPDFLLILGAYLLLNVAYSFFLKHRAIIDIVCIALGFVLRVLAGGVAAAVPISHWIVILTFLLAIFLALAKRRDDLLLAAEGQSTRRSIDGYSLEFVSISMAVMAAVIIVAYILYTVSPDTIKKHGTDRLYLTGFWVVLGLLRYLQLALVENHTASPTKILLQDRFLQAVLTLWVLSFFFLIYNFASI
ncbi:MAG: decaprenyl-phosphate phosphoribosyltransferase [Syntrophobacterales bacterium]|jgi:4-hydroxybenzoate polyprenyltransferase|nr:decaprenyl-phosphate phosphoribosyltransferase [Syntrophobacterales bacterium]